MPNTVFLDIETTGLDPLLHEIIEVAICFEQGSASFSLPVTLQYASPRALEVNRYYERQEELRSKQVDQVTAFGMFQRHLSKSVVVGNNPQFDLRFIEAYMRRRGAEDPTPWNYHPVDLKALVAGRYQLGPAPWTTSQIADAVGVPLPSDAHSALADAKWNRDVYRKVTS